VAAEGVLKKRHIWSVVNNLKRGQHKIALLVKECFEENMWRIKSPPNNKELLVYAEKSRDNGGPNITP